MRQAAVCQGSGMEELESLHAQTDAEEEKLAVLASDLDMLRIRRDALARARQVLEDEERAQRLRLEHVELLRQLRKLQDTQPWAAPQLEDAPSKTRENVAPNTRSSAESEHAREEPSVCSRHPSDGLGSGSKSVETHGRKVSAGEFVDMHCPDETGAASSVPPLHEPSQDLSRPGAASAVLRTQPLSAAEEQLAPVTSVACGKADPVNAPNGQAPAPGPALPEPTAAVLVPPAAAGSAAAAAAATASSLPSAPAGAEENGSRSAVPGLATKPSAAGAAPPSEKRLHEQEGDKAEDQRAGKKAKRNPMGFLCKFQVPSTPLRCKCKPRRQARRRLFTCALALLAEAHRGALFFSCSRLQFA